MSRLARSCLLLPLVCSAATGESRTIACSDDRSVVTARKVVRFTPEGFVISAGPPDATIRTAVAAVALGHSIRLDRALFDAPCHGEKGASHAPLC